MNDRPVLNRPRMYLDIDGVLIADESPFEQAQVSPMDHYAPEVTTRLGKTGLQLVWLSTWEEEASYLSANIDDLREGRILRLARPMSKASSITRKMLALIEDQEMDPAPFVWVDDAISARERNIVLRTLTVPLLILQPDTKIGLTENELTHIEDFARQYQL